MRCHEVETGESNCQANIDVWHQLIGNRGAKESEMIYCRIDILSHLKMVVVSSLMRTGAIQF